MADAVHSKKPLLWITVIALLIGIPITYFVTQQTRTRHLFNLKDRAQDALKVHMAHMQSEMENREIITRIVGTDERVISFLLNPNTTEGLNQVNHFLSRFKVTTGCIAYILDVQGKVLASGNWDTRDSFIGQNFNLRPYFKATVMGETTQYVAIGTKSNQLGYYVSIPIRHSGTIVGVAVTKTDPQDLIMSHERTDRLFIITDAGGVAIISSPKQYLFHTIAASATTGTISTKGVPQYPDIEIKPITNRPIQTVNQIRLITLPFASGLTVDRQTRNFVLAHATVSTVGWNAYILWPINGLKTTLSQKGLVTVLVLILTWLLSLYAVEHWRHIKQIQEHAFRDPLTRLYTRLYMLESAAVLLAAHDRNSIPGVSAIMFDLDRFKMINDQYGHSAGDNVLVKVASVLIKECRESDIPIRYGGEEFLIFVPTGDRQQVLQLSERIRLQIKKLDIKLAGSPVHLTISGGIATHMHGEPLEKLIDRADHMMYQAKQNGRNQIKWVEDLSKESES